MPTNFSFIQPSYPEIASALQKAEDDTYTDPHNSVMKCGIAIELMVVNIFGLADVEFPAKNSNLAKLIHILEKKNILKDETLGIAKIANSIKEKRNKAAHTLNILHAEAVNTLTAAYTFCVWFYGTFINRNFQAESFKAPAKPIKIRLREFINGFGHIGILTPGKFPIPDFTTKGVAGTILRITFPELDLSMDLTNLIVSASGELRIALQPDVRRGLESLNLKLTSV